MTTGNLLATTYSKLCEHSRRLFGPLTLPLLITILLLVSGVFIAVLISREPYWVFELLGVEKKFKALEFLGIAMGGVVLAIQAAASHRRSKAMESAAEAQTAAVLTTERGQRQERLRNGIEHLGHDSESVRLGGAYELFHLAKDHKDLQPAIVDILSAHVRHTTSREKYREDNARKPSVEIQSLLKLLSGQSDESRNDI